jgi:hypothetical protein
MTVEATATSVVVGELSETWQTLVEPETSLELDPTVYAAGRLGSTRGLGEIQYFMHRFEDGRTFVSVLEVTAYEHRQRAVARSASDTAYENATEVTVESLVTGDLRVTHRLSRTLPPGTLAGAVSRHERVLKAFAQELHEAVSRLFGVSGARGPAH